MAKAKFDIKTEATRPIYAYVGVTDRAVEAVRESVSDVQNRVSDIDFEPKALRTQADRFSHEQTVLGGQQSHELKMTREHGKQHRLNVDQAHHLPGGSTVQWGPGSGMVSTPVPRTWPMLDARPSTAEPWPSRAMAR